MLNLGRQRYICASSFDLQPSRWHNWNTTRFSTESEKSRRAIWHWMIPRLHRIAHWVHRENRLGAPNRLKTSCAVHAINTLRLRYCAIHSRDRFYTYLANCAKETNSICLLTNTNRIIISYFIICVDILIIIKK